MATATGSSRYYKTINTLLYIINSPYFLFHLKYQMFRKYLKINFLIFISTNGNYLNLLCLRTRNQKNQCKAGLPAQYLGLISKQITAIFGFIRYKIFQIFAIFIKNSLVIRNFIRYR